MEAGDVGSGEDVPDEGIDLDDVLKAASVETARAEGGCRRHVRPDEARRPEDRDRGQPRDSSRARDRARLAQALLAICP
jgi:hypothetical protein